jgi:hypothetical protein
MAKHKKPYKKKLKKKNKFLSQNFILGTFIVVLMVSSVFGIIFSGYNSNPSEDLIYNDYKFQVSSIGGFNKYTTTVNKEKFSFYYLPIEVEHLNISNSAFDSIKSKSFFYFTSDYDSLLKEDIALAQYELGESLINSFNSNYQVTFINNTSFPSVLQITCENATASVPVIYFRLTNTTSVENTGNCIFFNGDDRDSFLKLSTKVLYKLHGII